MQTRPITADDLKLCAPSQFTVQASRLRWCTLDILDMHCAACAALIEDRLHHCSGVRSVRVHYATQRAKIEFDPQLTDQQKLLAEIARIGYSANADAEIDRFAWARGQRRAHIWRFGLAVLCAMQVMMLTLPRFLAREEIEPELGTLLDWSALLFLLPVVVVCARDFYRGAWRELRIRRPGMDTAIVFGIGSASLGSVWHLALGTGKLYFDSVTMFIALLLGVRWLAWEQRERNHETILRSSATTANRSVMRLTGESGAPTVNAVAVSAVQPGDRLLIRTGEAFPVDCVLLSDVVCAANSWSAVRSTRGSRSLCKRLRWLKKVPSDDCCRWQMDRQNQRQPHLRMLSRDISCPCCSWQRYLHLLPRFRTA
jgi:Cu2+-exporting ATPase